MSLKHTPDGKTDKSVLNAAALAIKACEVVTGSFLSHDVTKEDMNAMTGAVRQLWSILESNGYTIDIYSNRLRRL